MNLRGERVLITGAGGFIGSHLAEHLVESGARVRAFVRYRSTGDRGWLDASPLAPDMEFASGDIRDLDSVQRAAEGCGAIFHLAALIGIPYSYVTPLAYLRTNIDGCYHVLEAARLHGVARVVTLSTSEVYGTARSFPMDETHPLSSQSPYAASKTAADQLALSYHRSFGVPVVLARPFNTYGPRQSARALIPAIVTQLLAGSGEVRLGNLSPTRDFTFVSDAVRGIAAAAQADSLVGEVVHVGSGEEISCGDLAARIAEAAGRPMRIVEDEKRNRPAASEVDRLVCDCTKLRARTGWHPEVPLEEGLKRTIAWIEQHLDHYRPAEYQV